MNDYLKQLNTFIELITDLAFFKNIKGEYTHCNNAFLELNQMKREALINKTDFDLFSNESAIQFRKDDAEILSSNQTKSYEEVLKRDNTSDNYYYTTKQIIYDSEGNKLGLFCIARDITLKKQYEFIYEDNRTLLEYIATHDSLSDVLDKIVGLAERRNSNSTCSILLLDETGTRLLSGSAPNLPDFYNEAINGIEIGEKVGSCGSAMFKQARVIVENIDKHENWQPYLALTKRANLHACWSEPIFSSNNKILGSFAIYSDRPKSPSDFDLKLISTYANLASVAIEKDNNYKAIRAKDEQLRQQSRLAQMGEMISMIAHQWRQPLASISATSIALQVELELETFDLKKEETRQEFRTYFSNSLLKIDSFVQNLTTTIDDFRNFYKPNKKSVTTTLEDVITKALNIIEGSLVSDNIEIVCEYKSKRMIELYDSEMMQVLLSILKNAQEHFKENKIENPQIKITSNENSISICDNAGGIPDGILPKIFDPYFSTKSSLQGTGLGLYMSKTIVEEHHNGNLIVQNRDNGACFIIEFGAIA